MLLKCFYLCSREVREMVDQYKKLDYPLHVLINNAAIQAPKGHRGEHTKDGIEVIFCTITFCCLGSFDIAAS